MKKGLLFLFVFLFFCGILILIRFFAMGPQQFVNVPIAASGKTAHGWLYLPADYDSTQTHYPVLLFYHGKSEAGVDPVSVLIQGVPKLLDLGMRPDHILNPADGKKYSFIVLSLHDRAWSPDPSWLPYELAWLQKNFRIDTNRIYLSGLSSGGINSFYACVYNDEVSRLVTAAAPMSAVALTYPYDSTLIKKYHIKTWFLSGSKDTVTVNSVAFNALCNRQQPGSSKLTVYEGEHALWNKFYDVDYRDTTNHLSLWQWFLQYDKSDRKNNPSL